PEDTGWRALGPIIQTFPLTLDPGVGLEAAGPFYYRYESEDGFVWGVPPLVSASSTRDGDRADVIILPPLYTWRRYGEETRWQMLQWLHGGRQERIEDPGVRRFN